MADPNFEVKEEIVLLFIKDGEVVAFERKNGGESIHRYMATPPTWGDTVELFGARTKQT